MKPAIELAGVTKTYGRYTAVDALDLSVPQGAVYGFIGPNGSGKTTTLRMILRILYPDAGHVVVLGTERGTTADDRLGYLPEERGLYPKMKVRELLVFHARLKGHANPRQSIDEWLERFDLTAWAEKKVEALSKGMAQKVQFIATVAARPQLVILDEPFTGLDPVNTVVLNDAVLALQNAGTTILFSTHDMETAERLCDTICMIHQGRKVLDGTLDEITSAYGQDTIRLRMSNGVADLRNLPGVVHTTDRGRFRELRLAAGTDPQAILRQLVLQTRVEHFEVTRPSLRDIFVRIAGPVQRDATEEPQHA
jgi:ABC-2 type transport system ATP-binding protein